MIKNLHVEENLEPGIEAFVRNLLPELFELCLVNRVATYVMFPSECSEHLTCELLRLLVHSC